MAIFEEDTFVDDNHPSHYKGEIDLFISSRGNKMKIKDSQDEEKISQRPFFLRSHSLSLREKPHSRSGSALTRRASNKKRLSKRNLHQHHHHRHSFSHHRLASNSQASPDSLRLMNCFETPPPRTMLGSKNSENWTSFHNRYAESSKRPRRQSKPKKSKEERRDIKSRRQRKKKGWFWSALSCFRPKDTTYHSDDEKYEWNDEKVWSLGKKYSQKLAETERRQLHLIE